MLEKVQADRQVKLEQIRALGIDPYGVRHDTNEAIASIMGRYKDDAPPAPADAAGRLVLLRNMGKLVFAHLRDQTGQMQVAFRKNAIDEKSWQLINLLDMGDLIAVSGPVQRTKTGEITIWAERVTLLCKSLNPMPEKFHGLKDVEIRYRQRYLDLMTYPEVMAVFRRRTAIIECLRRLLNARGFCEVETPVLQAIYGGAAAKPFVTHHNALDADLFLRISPELYLKRLLVGGMERVYEFSRNFRNEGIDTRHNPEFTLLELYQAYGDYDVMMEITEELIATAARDIAVPALLAEAQAWNKRLESLAASEDPAVKASADSEAVEAAPVLQAAAQCRDGRIVLPYGQILIDYTRPWRRAKYADLFAQHAGVSMADMPGVRAKARQLHIDEAGRDDAVVINDVLEATVEKHLVQPTFVMDYPAALCPLTRRKSDDPNTALRFECFIANMEVGNAYTELNDPAVQEANFLQQVQGEAKDETMRVMDEDFVTALRHGMPPAGGLGIGIDRVIMLLCNRQSIRDVVLIPQLRKQQ